MRSILLLALLLIQSPLQSTDQQIPKITVIGTGYVGLVLGLCLAHLGHKVTCTDIEKNKIDLLNNNIVPFFEPELDTLLSSALKNNTIIFTTDIPQAIQQADVIFIAVGTPSNPSGEADLSALESVTHTITENLNAYKIICIKSTVPIGTCKQIEKLIRENQKKSYDFDIVFNPEFLREGNAVYDFLNPDRIVLGTSSKRALEIMQTIYASFKHIPFVITNHETAEMIKYAANTFLATKISFINEIAHLCEVTGAHINLVAQGIGLDPRIGPHFLSPGPGFGGSCFPKDIQGLLSQAKKYNIDLKIARACLQVNEEQKMSVVQKIITHCNNNIQDKKIAILGLAFKPNTDDIRYSPSITVIEYLLKHGAYIKTYDPQAMHNMKKLFPDIEYCSCIDDAIQDSDLIVIMTEWDEFRTVNIQKIKSLAPRACVLDTRNIIDTNTLLKYQIPYENMGNAQSYTLITQ